MKTRWGLYKYDYGMRGNLKEYGTETPY